MGFGFRTFHEPVTPTKVLELMEEALVCGRASGRSARFVWEIVTEGVTEGPIERDEAGRTGSRIGLRDTLRDKTCKSFYLGFS